MSDWTGEYVPDAANVLEGLTQAQIEQVESLAARIADAVAVRRLAGGEARADAAGHGHAGQAGRAAYSGRSSCQETPNRSLTQPNLELKP